MPARLSGIILVPGMHLHLRFSCNCRLFCSFFLPLGVFFFSFFEFKSIFPYLLCYLGYAIPVLDSLTQRFSCLHLYLVNLYSMAQPHRREEKRKGCRRGQMSWNIGPGWFSELCPFFSIASGEAANASLFKST